MTLEEVCCLYYDMIYNRCLFKLYFNAQLAEDTTQEVFSILCYKWDRLKKDNIKVWLIRTADFKILKAKASFAKQRDTVVTMDVEWFPEDSYALDLDEQIIVEKVLRDFDKYHSEILSQLSAKEIYLINSLQQDLKYSEIARLLQTTEAAVAMNVCRLRKKVSAIVTELCKNL